MVKSVIRWALNHIPRRWLQCMAEWSVPIMGIAYVGRSRVCPICGTHLRKFMPYGYVTPREDALCPHCLSLERHRLIWLWLERHSNLFAAYPRLLHIAPEVSLKRHFKRHYRAHRTEYITADLESPLADMHFDVQHIPLEDNSIEVIICNHLFEHVADDRLAMRELHRVMRNGGWGIMLVPEDRSRATTFEDDSITDPAERTRLFGQYDHRRTYGRDYDDRLREAGFIVERIAARSILTEAEYRLYAVGGDDLIVVHKPQN